MMSADRPEERDAVRTTIVGGRPPGSGKDIGEIPRGIEVLVSKASLDAEFRALLLERRAKAADEIGLALSPAESMMLDAIPEGHLEAVIARTRVAPSNRRAFLGRAAAVMLAALGVGVAGCDQYPAPTGIAPDRPPTEGIRPDRPEPEAEPKPEPEPEPEPAPPTTQGIRPDRVSVTDGIRPDPPREPERKEAKAEEPKIIISTGIRVVPEDDR
jgi:hypothetical protein